MIRRKFGVEFEVEAVKLVTERGVSVAQASRDLDVAERILRRWMPELAAAFPGHGQQQADLTETEGAINRLIGMVETGMMEVDDPALAVRLKALKAKRVGLQSQITNASAAEPAQQPRRRCAKPICGCLWTMW